MKKLMLFVAAVSTLLLGGSGTAKAQDTGVLVQIAAAILANQFGVGSNSIFDDSQQYGVPVYDLQPAYAIRSRSRNVSMDRIYQLRRAGLSWSQIAYRVGLPAATVKDLAMRGYLDSNTYWSNVAYSRYRVPRSQFLAVRRAGADWNQAFLASQIARDLRTEPIYVYRSYRTNRSWDRLRLPNRKTVVVYVPVKTSPLYRVWHPTRSTSHHAISKTKSNSRVSKKTWSRRDDDRVIRKTTVRNPAQTIRKTQVKQDGKVRTRVTHTKNAKASHGVRSKPYTKQRTSVKVKSKSNSKSKHDKGHGKKHK
jgi:hypothetical protein